MKRERVHFINTHDRFVLMFFTSTSSSVFASVANVRGLLRAKLSCTLSRSACRSLADKHVKVRLRVRHTGHELGPRENPS